MSDNGSDIEASPVGIADPRTAQMHGLYLGGATLEEVGARFGLSRERVHQIFAEAGIPTRSARETATLRHQRLVDERGEQICDAFARSKDIAAIAHRFGASRKAVREIVAERFPPSERRHGGRLPVYSDEELIAFLREAAAAVPGRLTTGAYARYAAGRRTDDSRPWPSFQTPAKRFGTWCRACERAGFGVPRS